MEVKIALAIGHRAEESSQVLSYLEKMMECGSIRREWCLVIEEDGRMTGRIAFWTLPKVGKPLAMVLLELPWDRDDVFTVGKAVMESALPILKANGAETIEYMVDSPPVAPQFQRHMEIRLNILEQMGFSLTRETNRFEWKADHHPLLTAPCSLTFRSLPEAGDDAFEQAIMKVSAQTLDQRIQDERLRLGAEQHAVQLFTELKSMEYDPHWWQLAYDPNEQLVGFVMPAKAPAFSTIAYIGVVPKQRGLGYIDQLLRQGTSTLLAAGESLIRADTDIHNTPMAEAFIRCGYVPFSARKEYVCQIPQTANHS